MIVRPPTHTSSTFNVIRFFIVLKLQGIFFLKCPLQPKKFSKAKQFQNKITETMIKSPTPDAKFHFAFKTDNYTHWIKLKETLLTTSFIPATPDTALLKHSILFFVLFHFPSLFLLANSLTRIICSSTSSRKIECSRPMYITHHYTLLRVVVSVL